MAEAILHSGRKKSPPLRPLTPEEQQFVEENLGLARKEANRIAWAMVAREGYRCMLRNQFFDELVDAAYIGLCVGIQRYVPNEKCKPSSYCYQWIRNFVQAASGEACIRTAQSSARSYLKTRVTLISEIRTLHSSDGNSSGETDVLDDRHGDDPDVPQEPSTELLCLMSLVLDAREVRIISETIFAGRTLESVGLDCGISKERTRQLQARALLRLSASPGFIEALRNMTARSKRLTVDDFRSTNVVTRIA